MLFWLQLMLRRCTLASLTIELKPVREVLHKQEKKKIPTEKLVQVAEYVSKTNFFEVDG